MSKKAVVTGVTGMDGSHMVDYLLENTDLHIYGGVRRLSVPNHKNIEHNLNNPRFDLIDLDLLDPHNISGVIEKIKPDYFINFAAQSFVGCSWDMPVATWKTNVDSVLHILEAIRKHSPKTRFYHAGSSEEFGDVQYSPQNEEHPLRPRSPYGASKAAGRHLVKVYRESYNLYAVQGWLFNHECLSANTPLLLSINDKIKIDYVRNLMSERTDISHDRNILTKNFDGLKIWDGNNFVKIKAISRKKISTLEKENQKIIYTNTRKGVVATTPNHSLYVNEKKTIVKNLSVGSVVDHVNLSGVLNDKISYTPQQCRLLGYLVGDGYVNEKEIKFVNRNKEVLNDFVNCVEQTHPSAICKIQFAPSGFGGEGSERVAVYGIPDYCKVYKKEIYDKKTKHKKVPDGILNSDKKSKEGFFKAYYACDGLKNGESDFLNARWTSFKTNSPILAHGLLVIFQELTDKNYNINVFEQNGKIYYQINLLTGSNKGKHLLKPQEEIKKFIEKDRSDCFVYDIETESGYFSGGVGRIKIGNSERRGDQFVTQKIAKEVARIRTAMFNGEKFEPLKLGNMSAQRDWSYSPDFVDAVWRMLNQEVYNIKLKESLVSQPVDTWKNLVSNLNEYVCASGETHTVAEFVSLAFEAAGIDVSLQKDGDDWSNAKFVLTLNPEIVVAEVDPKFFRPAEVELLLGDSSKLRGDLNWQPHCNFKTLVEKMVNNQIKEKI